jgi:hypothetical protein
MRTFLSSVCLAISLSLVVQTAHAHTTVCDRSDAVRFDYGTKVTAVVWVPRARGDEFRAGVEAFFEEADYSIGGVSMGDEIDPSSFWEQLPQSPSHDVSFAIETRRDRDFAVVTLSTFSFECGKTEDWRPHWDRFRAHLGASRFKKYTAWRPWFPEASQMVGGARVPLWELRSRLTLETVIAQFQWFGQRQL